MVPLPLDTRTSVLKPVYFLYRFRLELISCSRNPESELKKIGNGTSLCTRNRIPIRNVKWFGMVQVLRIHFHYKLQGHGDWSKLNQLSQAIAFLGMMGSN